MSVIISLILGLPWFILTWINLLISPLSLTLNLIAIVFIILFLAFTAIVILLYILKSTEVSKDILYAAISIYFLIGGTFSTIYIFLNTIEPGSIINNINSVVTTSDLLYFSYVTLTTLGYGEIIPVNAYARSLAIIEAIIGVMYIAIIISRMVGLFISNAMKN
jgi:voltage-gated potassium channel Kch